MPEEANFMAHELQQPPSANDVMNLKDMLEFSDNEAETKKREEKIKLAKEIFDDPEAKEEDTNLDNWLAEVQEKDNMLRKASEIKKVVPTDKLPPVRNAAKKEKRIQQGPSDVEVEKQKDKKPSAKKDINYYSYDYFKEWDKFDVDKELERIEKEEKKKEEYKSFSKAAVDYGEEVHDPYKTYNVESMTALERRMAAQREKEKGNECMKCGEINAAVAYYSKALELRPGDHLVLGNRAQAYIGIHCYYQAELDCDQALAIDKNYTKARYRRAVAKTEQGKHKEALEDLRDVLAEQPDNKAAQSLLDKAERKKDKKEQEAARKKAEEEERKQYEAAPRRKIEILEDSDDEEEEDEGLDSKALQQAREAIKAKEEREQKAAAEEKEASQLKRDAEVRLLQLGEARTAKTKGNDSFKAKDLKAAEAHYSRALAVLGEGGDKEVQQERALVLTNRALVHVQQGRFEQADADCTAAIAANSDWAKAHHRRGVARMKLGRLEEALEDLERAIKLEPDSTSTLDEIRKLKQLQAQQRMRQQQQPPAATRRVQIEEIESDEEEEEEDQPAKQPGQSEGSRRVQVVEVDDESEEEKEEEGVAAPVSAEDDGEVMEDDAVASVASSSSTRGATKVAISEVDDDDDSEGEVVECQQPAVAKVVPASTARKVAIETVEDDSDSGDDWVQVHSPSKAKGPEPAEAPAPVPAPAPATASTEAPEAAEEERVKAVRAPWEEREGRDVGRLRKAKASKEAADDGFKKGLFEQAVGKYTEALEQLEAEEFEPEQLVCFLNRAACFLQIRDYGAVIADCAQVLCIDPSNVKGLVRRGLAYEGMERPAKAAADMRAALSIEFAGGAAQSPLAGKARECLERCKRLDPSLKSIPIPMRSAASVPQRPASPPSAEQPVKTESKVKAKEEKVEEAKSESVPEKKLTLREQILGKKAQKKEEVTPTSPAPKHAEALKPTPQTKEAESPPQPKTMPTAAATASSKVEKEQREAEKEKSEEELADERRREAVRKARSAEAEEHKNRGNKAFKEGKFKSAIMNYSAAIDLEDDNACFHTNLAAAHIALKDFPNALKMADKANRLDPSYAKALYRKAQALEGLGRLQEAVEAYDAGLALLPDSKQMMDGRAAAVRGMQAQEEAPAAALAAIKEKLKQEEVKQAEEVKAAAMRQRAKAAPPHPEAASPKQPAAAAAGAPQTAPEFKRGLKNLRKDSAALHAFLTLADPAMLPKFLSSGVEEDDLVLLVSVLEEHGLAADAEHSFRLLQNLAKVPRAGIVCAMLDRKDAKQLETLILKLHPAKTGSESYDVKAWTDLRKALGV